MRGPVVAKPQPGGRRPCLRGREHSEPLPFASARGRGDHFLPFERSRVPRDHSNGVIQDELRGSRFRGAAPATQNSNRLFSWVAWVKPKNGLNYLGAHLAERLRRTTRPPILRISEPLPFASARGKGQGMESVRPDNNKTGSPIRSSPFKSQNRNSTFESAQEAFPSCKENPLSRSWPARNLYEGRWLQSGRLPGSSRRRCSEAC